MIDFSKNEIPKENYGRSIQISNISSNFFGECWVLVLKDKISD